MRRNAMVLGLILLLAPTGAAAQRGGVFRPERPAAAAPRPRAAGARRQALQQAIYARFMDRVAARLELAPAARVRVEQVLRADAVQRRELAREARDARRDLMAATADPNTPPGDYDRLLSRIGDLRARDLDLWRREQADLARILTPRQRAQLMAMRFDLQEMVQRARAARRPPPGDTAGPS